MDDAPPAGQANENGELHGVARIGAGDSVARGVVICPLGHWRKVEGGPTANSITRTAFADLGNAPTFSDTRVEVAAG